LLGCLVISQIPGKLLKRLQVLYAMYNAERDTKSRLKRKNIRNILVMCYGNIYRSPFVAKYLADRLGEEFKIRSAGFHPKPRRVSPEAHVKMCLEYNVDLSAHRSTVVSQELIDWAEVIIIMDRHNWYALADYDNATSKVIWLGAMILTKNYEIEDPYSANLDLKKKIIDQLFSASRQLVARLS